jgi:hypothetical protein
MILGDTQIAAICLPRRVEFCVTLCQAHEMYELRRPL